MITAFLRRVVVGALPKWSEAGGHGPPGVQTPGEVRFFPAAPGTPTLRDDAGNREELIMGLTDKIKDKAEALEGEGKKKVGDATDNEQLQAEGKAEQMKGDLKQAGEKVKDAF